MTKLIRENCYGVASDESLVSFLLAHADFVKSAQQVNDFFQDKRLLVNDVCVKADVLLRAGDIVTLLTPQSLEPPVNDDIRIVFEDEDLFVVDKPAPLPMHPAGKYYFNTLTSILARQFRGMRLHAVHRLDSETSGLVVFAKSREVADALRKQFLAKAVKKTYKAVVFGVPEPRSGCIEQPLVETTYGDIRNRVLPVDVGHVAKTGYEVQRTAVDNSFALLILRPFTGRKHQLRVHLAFIGHPIVGDKVYGAHPSLFAPYVDNPVNLAPTILEKLLSLRQFLHCERLEFLHPKKSNNVFFESKIREDMVDFLQKRFL